jgi:hypothetical protein
VGDVVAAEAWALRTVAETLDQRPESMKRLSDAVPG